MPTPDNIARTEPWAPITDERVGRALESEARREIGAGHVLAGVEAFVDGWLLPDIAEYSGAG